MTSAINAVLRRLNISEIKGFGGFETQPTMLMNTTTAEVNICEQ